MVKIPFAYSPAIHRVVEVSSVPSGRACGCLCPSCGQAVQAKKGSVNQWYFSHDPNPDNSPSEECEISFLVSCRQFIIDAAIAGDLPDITTPPVIYFGKEYRESRSFTSLKWRRGTSNFDLSTTIESAQLHVYLSYPGRESPVIPEKPGKAGFLEIDIQPIQKAIDHKLRDGKNVLAQTRELFTAGGGLLFFGPDSFFIGRWVYHPLEDSRDIVAEKKRREAYAAELRSMPVGPGRDFRKKYNIGLNEQPLIEGASHTHNCVKPSRPSNNETRYPKGYKGLTEAEKKLARGYPDQFEALVVKHMASGINEEDAKTKAAIELMAKVRTGRLGRSL